MTTQDQLKANGGYNGGLFITDTTNHVLGFDGVIYVVEDAVFNIVVGNISGTLTGFSQPAGAFLPGIYTEVRLTSGKVMALRTRPVQT